MIFIELLPKVSDTTLASCIFDTVRQFLNPVLLTGGKSSKLKAVSHKITQLPNAKRRHEASSNKVVLEKVSNPFGILFVGLLAPNSL